MDSSDSPKYRYLQEHYEQRLRNLVAMVHATSEDLRADDIISAMKANPVTLPYAQQRAREVWENALEKERETAITTLMTELADAKRTIRELEGQLTDSHRAVASAEDKVREEIAKADELTREAEKIHQKASASTLSFEESIRKRESEAYIQLSKARSEYDSLKSDFDKLEADYERKSQELEATYQELAECTSSIHAFQREIETLNAKLERQDELHQFHEKMSIEYQEADTVMQERITALNVEISRLKGELRDSQSNNQRLESKLQHQSETFLKQQDALSRKYADTQTATEQRYEDELNTLRGKVAGYKQQLQDTEMQLQESQRSMDNIRERWQQEITGLRSEHEMTKSGMEKQREKVDRSYEQREADLRKQYEGQVEALHNHYKQVVLEKSRDFEGELTAEREQWRGRERTLKGKIEEMEADLRDNYVSLSEHELALQEKDISLEQTIKRIKSEIDEGWSRKAKEDTDRLRKETQAVIDQLISKLRGSEESRDEVSLAKRKLEEDLQLANQQTDKLKENLSQIHSDFSSLHKAHSATSQDLEKTAKELDEANESVAALKRSDAALHETVSAQQREIRALSDKLREQELSSKAKLIEQATSDREQMRLLEQEADQFKALSEQVRKELETYKRANSQLAAEKDAAVKDAIHKEMTSQEVIRSVRAEEAEKSNSHLRVHHEVRGKLSTTESALIETQAELDSLANSYAELKADKANADVLLTKASDRVSDLESTVKQTERQLKELKSRSDATIRALKSVNLQYTKHIRKLKALYRTQLAQLQSDVLQELQTYNKSLSFVTSKCLLGLDDRMLTLQRRYQTEIIDRQEQAESLQRRMEKSKTDAHAWVKSLESDHQTELNHLSDLNKQLAVKLRTVEEEHSSLAFQLEKTRQELLNKEEIRENQSRDCVQMQDLLRRLQQENGLLREKAKNDTEAKLKLLESEYAKEMQRMSQENDRARILSEQSLAQLKAEVEALQAAHTEDTNKLMGVFRQKLTEKEAAFESLRSATNEEIARLRSELYQVRRKTESSLEYEVEGLVSNLRYQNRLKERDVDEGKPVYRKDPARASDTRFDTRLSLSQLTPNRK